MSQSQFKLGRQYKCEQVPMAATIHQTSPLSPTQLTPSSLVTHIQQLQAYSNSLQSYYSQHINTLTAKVQQQHHLNHYYSHLLGHLRQQYQQYYRETQMLANAINPKSNQQSTYQLSPQHIPPTSKHLLTSQPNHLLTSQPNHLLTSQPNHLLTSQPNHLLTSQPNHLFKNRLFTPNFRSTKRISLFRSKQPHPNKLYQIQSQYLNHKSKPKYNFNQ